MDANTAVAIVEIDGKFLNHGGWIFLFFMPKIMRLDAFQCLRCGDCGYYEKSKKGQISFSDEAGMPAWHMSFLGLTAPVFERVPFRSTHGGGHARAALAVGHGNHLFIFACLEPVLSPAIHKKGRCYFGLISTKALHKIPRANK